MWGACGVGSREQVEAWSKLGEKLDEFETIGVHVPLFMCE